LASLALDAPHEAEESPFNKKFFVAKSAGPERRTKLTDPSPGVLWFFGLTVPLSGLFYA
jgi:hypothetical protein